LSHENIVKFIAYYSDEKKGVFIILTEYVPFITLKSFLNLSNVDLLQTTDLFKKILLCVHYLHEQKILHRDINIENILICPKTHEFKLVDFGLALNLQTRTFVCNDEGNLDYRFKDSDFSMEDPLKIDYWGLGLVLLSLFYKKTITTNLAMKIIEIENIDIFKNKPFLNQSLKKLLGIEELKDGKTPLDELAQK